MKKELSLYKLSEERILMIRGHRVMLSPHLAEMYGVEVRVLVQAVKRNIERFPADFMFQLNDAEAGNLKSHFVISSWGGSRRANPYAFTEQGVSMLSGVLHSKQAVQVSIAIMRTFVKPRRMLSAHKELSGKFAALEGKLEKHDDEISVIFDAIRELMAPKDGKVPRIIGFRPEAG